MAAVGVTSQLLSLEPEFVRLQACRLPDIPESGGAPDGGIRIAPNENGELFALRRQRPEVALLVVIELFFERGLGACPKVSKQLDGPIESCSPGGPNTPCA